MKNRFRVWNQYVLWCVCFTFGCQISQAMISPGLASWKIIGIWSKFFSCAQYLIKFWKVAENCGTLWTVGTSVQVWFGQRLQPWILLNIPLPQVWQMQKKQVNSNLPDIPYQTSMKPRHISPPSLARSSAAKLVRNKGTSTKTHSNKSLVYMWW